jgi:mono/diheme cytochrome c family protein
MISSRYLSALAATSLVALGAAYAVRTSRAQGTPPQTTSAPTPAPPPASEGERLFIGYNCADCHGYGGVGSMGPSFQDGRWRFGGSEEEVFRSISDGRPDGMPRWGRMIPAAHIRTLTTYVRSLATGKDVTTMSFADLQGAVDRPGH